ncbi:MAG: DUF5320 domain-containing protein [Candidatus Diapherotrites archaeon]
MPGNDGTGPMGAGAFTGRGFGSCGRGRALRRGRGRGFGYGFRGMPLELSKEERVKILKAEKEDIEKELKELGE